MNSEIHDEHTLSVHLETMDWWTGVPEYKSGMMVTHVEYACTCGADLRTRADVDAHLRSLSVEVGS